MIDIVWDMETQDPDDFLTLLLLLGHPEVRLKAVTITPGSGTWIITDHDPDRFVQTLLRC